MIIFLTIFLILFLGLIEHITSVDALILQSLVLVQLHSLVESFNRMMLAGMHLLEPVVGFVVDEQRHLNIALARNLHSLVHQVLRPPPLCDLQVP